MNATEPKHEMIRVRVSLDQKRAMERRPANGARRSAKCFAKARPLSSIRSPHDVRDHLRSASVRHKAACRRWSTLPMLERWSTWQSPRSRQFRLPWSTKQTAGRPYGSRCSINTGDSVRVSRSTAR